MNNVYCDECGKYTSISLKEKKHPRDIHEKYSQCDHCYWHYTVSVTNKRVRKLQRRMKEKGIPYTKGGTSKEQTEIDNVMSMLKYNLINYGVADLHER